MGLRSGRVLTVPTFLLSGLVAGLGAGGCESTSEDEPWALDSQSGEPVGAQSGESVAQLSQPIYCYVGVPEAVGSACARANEQVSVTASSLSSPTPPLLETDRVAYGVRLVPSEGQEGVFEGSVRFRPARTGTYNLYLGAPNLPLTVRGPGGDVAFTCSSPVSPAECNKLRRVNTYDLEADQEYTIEVGPTSEARFLRIHLQTLQTPLDYCSADDLRDRDLACDAAEAGEQRLNASELGAPSPPEVEQEVVYSVRLPGVGATEYAGEFVFSPPASGDYQIYLGTPRISLAVSGAEGHVQPSCSTLISETNCRLLRRADVYSLQAGSAYRLRLGPNVNTRTVRVTIRRFEAIDECALGLDDCDREPRACVDQLRGFECRCPGGYLGDGIGPEGCQPSLIQLHSVREFPTGTQDEDGSVSGAPVFMRLADLDADGALDVVVSIRDDAGGYTQLEMLRGDGTGDLETVNRVGLASPGETVVSDFDGDGTADIVGVAFDGQGPLPSSYLRGLGNLQYERTSWYGADWGPFVNGADFDEDGTLEIVVSYYDSTTIDGLPAGFRVLRVPEFTALQDHPMLAAGQAITGDFDGDGHQDVLAYAGGALVQLYRGDGTGEVHLASSTTLPGEISRMEPVDLNADGRTDLMASEREGFVMVSYGGPDGLGEAQRVAAGVPFAGDLTAGDFDHDGQLDIAVGSAREARIAVLVARPAGFEHGGFLDTPGSIRSLAAADLDGDGWHELLSASVTGVSVFYSDAPP